MWARKAGKVTQEAEPGHFRAVILKTRGIRRSGSAVFDPAVLPPGAWMILGV
ncbi:MAG: hypothetical protein ACOC5A_03040 [Halanaerobiales bacterium]